MNKWVKKSIDLAKSKGYLDNLFSVYPIELGASREVSNELKLSIRKALKNKNKKKLIIKLLKLPRFPIDDPYVSSLRKAQFLLDKNPKTVARIGKRLISIGLENILKLASQPKSPSRQFGHTFRNWLKTLGYPFLSEEKFLKDENKTVFLKGSDNALKKFAIKNLKIKKLDKGLDFVLKVKNKIILGEAKFLTSHGGTQDNQFNYAVRVAKIKRINIIGITVLDGVVWFESGAHMHKTVKKIKGTALSSLLLKNFIKEIEKNLIEF